MRPGLIEAEYLDIVEAGQYLGVIRPIAGDADPARTFKRQVWRMYQLVQRGHLKPHRIGKRLFFDKRQLDQVMRSGGAAA